MCILINGVLSLIIASLATYFGGDAFFNSSLSIAATFKAMLITTHVQYVFFVVVFFISYHLLAWATFAMVYQFHHKKRR